VARLHELLLNDVLDLLDAHERLVRGNDALRDGLRDRNRGRGVARQGKKRFSDGDLDLLVVPRDDMAVSPDHPNRALDAGVAADRELAGAVEQEALGHHVGVVVDQRLLDELVEAVERQAQRILQARKLGKVCGQFTADLGHPGAVLLGEDFLLALRDADVRERLAQRVGNLGDVEALLPVRAQEDYRGKLDRARGDDIAPGVYGLLFKRGVDRSLEGQVLGKGDVAHCLSSNY
jgi:hypothetical protein